MGCLLRFTVTGTSAPAGWTAEHSSGRRFELGQLGTENMAGKARATLPGAASVNSSRANSNRRIGQIGIILVLTLAACALAALWAGYREITWGILRHDEMARSIFFRLRLPRVVLAGIVGATLALVGAALQAMFRNPL